MKLKDHLYPFVLYVILNNAGLNLT